MAKCIRAWLTLSDPEYASNRQLPLAFSGSNTNVGTARAWKKILGLQLPESHSSHACNQAGCGMLGVVVKGCFVP